MVVKLNNHEFLLATDSGSDNMKQEIQQNTPKQFKLNFPLCELN